MGNISFVVRYREEHDRKVAQQMHEETAREQQQLKEMEVCLTDLTLSIGCLLGFCI